MLCGLSASWPAPGWVVYHWGHVDGDSLLQYAQHYEQAYQALVGCSHQLPPPLLTAVTGCSAARHSNLTPLETLKCTFLRNFAFFCAFFFFFFQRNFFILFAPFFYGLPFCFILSENIPGKLPEPPTLFWISFSEAPGCDASLGTLPLPTSVGTAGFPKRKAKRLEVLERGQL
eukprot:EG_transcript_11946